jgi:hypothetical protein
MEAVLVACVDAAQPEPQALLCSLQAGAAALTATDLVPALANCHAARHCLWALMQAHLQGLVRLSPSRQIQHTLLSSPGKGGAPATAAAAATTASI